MQKSFKKSLKFFDRISEIEEKTQIRFEKLFYE